MSSILKALKKVEKESPNLDVVPDLPRKIDTKKAVNQRAKGDWLFKRTITVVVMVLVLGLGTWFILANRDFLERKPTGEGTPLQNPAPMPVVVSKKAGEQVPAPAKPKEVPHQGPSITVAPDRKAAAPAEKKSKETIPALPKTTGAPVGSAETRATRQDRVAPASEGHRDESRFKLEAIVWSASPESRFAVINGRIVKSGGNVEGLSVVDIGRDHVAVRSSGREWNLKFTVE
ncbi:MAG: hypothetical protein JXL84_00830 [Deltaproteobacteria bacterium]|nr:hypothetical protein [Deltaproteobacteria bacterium]